MCTRMWQTKWMAAGLLTLAAAGCQPAKNGPASASSSRAVSRLPADPAGVSESPPAEILPDTHVAAGRLHESQGRLARAAEQYRLAIGAKPDHLEAHNRLGVVLDQLGKYKEADQAFARAIRLAPQRAYLHNNLAFSYIMQGRWAEAQEELTRALELQPDFPRARVNLGTVLAQQDRFEQALDNFRQVLRPEDAYYNLGLMYQSKKHPVEAAQAFKAALEANPKMAAAQKRLDLLPPSAVSEADKLGGLFVTPMALTGTATPPNAAMTRPAEPTSIMIVEPPDLPAPADTPEEMSADEEQVDQTDAEPLTERDETQNGLFSQLSTDDPPAEDAESESSSPNEPSAAASTWGWLARPTEWIRSAVASIQPLVDRLSPLDFIDANEVMELASPLPPEVPVPDAEEPAVYDLQVSPSPSSEP